MAATQSTPVETRPERPLGPRLWRWAIAIVILIAAVWSVTGLNVSVDRLLNAPDDAWNVLKRMWPPAFSIEIKRGVIGKVLQSVYIAWVGTVIGALISLPLSFMAAGNVSPRLIRYPIRQLFNAIRSVPELIVAVILIAVTGLGPWAGALAIGLHSIGTLGKLSSEAVENIDPGPIEAVDAAGGRWISAMRWAVFPQVLPVVVSYWLFRFEINVRASAVLGLIGAGGIGSELVSQLNFRNFPEVGAVLFVTIVAVITIDLLSSALRRAIIQGGTGQDPSRSVEVLDDLTGISFS